MLGPDSVPGRNYSVDNTVGSNREAIENFRLCSNCEILEVSSSLWSPELFITECTKDLWRLSSLMI